MIRHVIDPEAEPWSAATVLGTLARLNEASCPLDETTDFPEPYPLAGVMLRAALVRHCDGLDWSIRWSEAAGTFAIDLTGDQQTYPTMTLDPASTDGQLGIRFLLDINALSDQADVTRAVTQLLHPARADDVLRAALLRTAIAQSLAIKLPDDILDSNNLDVRRSVFEFERRRDQDTLTSDVVERIGGRDEFYVEFAGRLELDAEQLSQKCHEPSDVGRSIS